MPDVEFVALHSLDEAVGKSFQHEFGVAQCFSDLPTLLEQCTPDVIDAVTPPESHAHIIEQCLASNTALIRQKPFCRSPEEAEQMVELIHDKKTFVAVHENFRFQPWYQEIHNIIHSGQLGDIYEINFNLRPGDGQGPKAYLDRQPYFQTQPRFLMQETGVHFIDVFRFLLGDISGLFARLAKLNPVIAGEDAGVIVMEFKNGARGVLNCNRLADHAANNARLTMGEMRIEGSNANVYLNGNGQIHIRRHGSTHLEEHTYQWQDIDFGGDCVYRTNRHIADHLLYDKAVQNIATEYVENRRIEQAVYASAESGSWIKL